MRIQQLSLIGTVVFALLAGQGPALAAQEATGSPVPFVTVSVMVVDLACLDLTTARAIIEAEDLLLGATTPEYAFAGDSWLVHAQFPEAGTWVPPGTAVDLQLRDPVEPCPGVPADGQAVTPTKSVGRPDAALSCVAATGEPFTVGSVVFDASLSFEGAYVAAQKEEADCLGIELDVLDGQRDPAAQAAAIEQFIEEGKDLIIVVPADPAGIVPVIQAAGAAGIPVIATVLRVGEDADVVTFVGYDEYVIGRRQGEMVVAAVGEEARVGLIRGEEGSWRAPIEQGLTDYLAEHPGIEVVERQVSDGDEALLLAVTEEWLSTYPPGELAAIVAQGLEVVSAAQLATDQGRSDVAFFGGYYTDTIDEAISDGLIHGTILEDPRTIGIASIQDAYRWLTGDQGAVERPEHPLLPTIVTIGNVGEYPAWVITPPAIPTPDMGPALEPEPAPDPGPDLTSDLTSDSTPTAPPLASGDLERVARQMCLRARPDDIYRVKASVVPARAARDMDSAHLVLVDYRDLRGVRRPEPRLRADSVYDVLWSAPFDWGSVEDIDVLACLALRATRRETWQNTTTQTRYTIDAADAIMWMVDATDGKMIGRPWVRHPRHTSTAPTLTSGEVLIGKRGPGLRPPPEAAIIRDVTRFLGQ